MDNACFINCKYQFQATQDKISSVSLVTIQIMVIFNISFTDKHVGFSAITAQQMKQLFVLFFSAQCAFQVHEYVGSSYLLL